jgi:hypothetical protein
MKTDTYTKFILTVIALCLIWLCVGGSPRVVNAQSPQHIVIDGATPVDGIPIWITKPVVGLR